MGSRGCRRCSLPPDLGARTPARPAASMSFTCTATPGESWLDGGIGTSRVPGRLLLGQRSNLGLARNGSDGGVGEWPGSRPCRFLRELYRGGSGLGGVDRLAPAGSRVHGRYLGAEFAARCYGFSHHSSGNNPAPRWTLAPQGSKGPLRTGSGSTPRLDSRRRAYRRSCRVPVRSDGPCSLLTS